MSKERPHGDTAEEQPRRSVQKASVRVTVALSPSDFYAQIGTDDQLALFDEFSSSLSSWCDEHCGGNVPELPSLGIFVAIKNPAVPRAWFRAVVTSHLNSGEIECNLMDTGATQRVPLTNLCSSSPPMITYMAAQALHCTLVDLQPTGANQWSDRTVSRFQQLVTAVGPKQALVYSNQDSVWPVSIILKNGEKWTPISKILEDEQLATYIPMFHVVEAVEALSSTQSNSVHSFPAPPSHTSNVQRSEKALLPCNNNGASRHEEKNVPASSSKQLEVDNVAKSGYTDKKDDVKPSSVDKSTLQLDNESLDSDDDVWDNSLLPPVSKEGDNVEADAEKQRKKANLLACYSALLENGENFKTNSSLTPNQKSQHTKNARSNRRRLLPDPPPPVNNYSREQVYPLPPQSIPLGSRGRGSRRGGRGGGRGGGMDQCRWYGPRGGEGTPHRQLEWRDRRFGPEQNPHFRLQFGSPPRPPHYFPPPPPPLGPPPPPMPSSHDSMCGLPNPPNVLAMTEQTMKNEVNWLSWRIENDIKKMTGQSAICRDTKVFTGEIYKVMTTSNALKLFNLAGSDAPFRAVFKALLHQVLLKPALVKIVVYSILELYEYSADSVTNCLQPLLEEVVANLDKDKCSIFCTFLAKLFFSSIGNDSESIFPPAASIIRHFLDSWVRCNSEKSPSDAKLFATLCEEVGPTLDSANRETLDEYFKSVVRNNILKETLSRASREVFLDLTVKRALWIEAQKTTRIAMTQKTVLTNKPQEKVPTDVGSEDKSDDKSPRDTISTSQDTPPSTSTQPLLSGSPRTCQPLPPFPAHPLAHFPSQALFPLPHLPSKFSTPPRPPPHLPSSGQAQSYAQPFHFPVTSLPTPMHFPPSLTQLPPPSLPPPSRISAHRPPLVQHTGDPLPPPSQMSAHRPPPVQHTGDPLPPPSQMSAHRPPPVQYTGDPLPPPSQMSAHRPPPVQHTGDPLPPPSQMSAHRPPPVQYTGDPLPPPSQMSAYHPPPVQHTGDPLPPPSQMSAHRPPPVQYTGDPLPPPSQMSAHHPPPVQHTGDPLPPPSQMSAHHPPPVQHTGDPLPPPSQMSAHRPPPVQHTGDPLPLPSQMSAHHQPPVQYTGDPLPLPSPMSANHQHSLHSGPASTEQPPFSQLPQHMEQSQPVSHQFSPTSQSFVQSSPSQGSATQQQSAYNDQVSSVSQHNLETSLTVDSSNDHTTKSLDDSSYASQQQPAKKNTPATDPYHRITSMLQELDLSRLLDNFYSSMIKDHQLLAPKDDLKSALKEAGIPPGAVLAITQYLNDQPNTVSSQKQMPHAAVPSANLDSCAPAQFVHQSQDQVQLHIETSTATSHQQLPAHQITATASLPLPPPLHQLETPFSVSGIAQYNLPQPASLPSQPPFRQSHQPPAQPQVHLAQPQPDNQPTSQPQLVGRNKVSDLVKVSVAQHNEEQLLAMKPPVPSPRILLPPSKQHFCKDDVPTPTSTQANVGASAQAESPSTNQVPPKTTFGSKGVICSLCGSCLHRSSYCPQRNDLLFRSHVD